MSHHFIPVCEATSSLNLIFTRWCSYCVAHEANLDWAQREQADQHLNEALLRLLFVSHFCQVWQLIKLKKNEAMFNDYRQNSFDIHMTITHFFFSNCWLF